jgi:7-cyano-7-deazaguanine synthase in queuosine biosynthesis
MSAERKPRSRKSAPPSNTDDGSNSLPGDDSGRTELQSESDQPELSLASTGTTPPLGEYSITDPTILLMYSGGLDSLGTLYQLLIDQQYFRQRLHVHHIHLHNKEARCLAEEIAVKKTLDFFRTPEYRPFSYSESFFGFPSFNRNLLWDTDPLAFIAANICKLCPAVTRVAFGLTLTDVKISHNPGLAERLERRDSVMALYGAMGKIFYPMIDLTKQEVYDSLPKGVRDLAWSCRTPVLQGTEYVPCGKCRTCGLESLQVKR